MKPATPRPTASSSKPSRVLRQLEGPKAYEGEVTCEWRSTNASVADSENVAQAMIDSLNGTAAASSLGLFSFFQIRDENTAGDRPDSKTQRKRIRTFPIVAKLK
jgi:hypothetical protein